LSTKQALTLDSIKKVGFPAFFYAPRKFIFSAAFSATLSATLFNSQKKQNGIAIKPPQQYYFSNPNCPALVAKSESKNQ